MLAPPWLVERPAEAGGPFIVRVQPVKAGMAGLSTHRDRLGRD